MEIEAKFRVGGEQVFSDLLALAALGPFQLAAEAGEEDQRNVYFDTADRRLRQARYGLRVRTIGARRIATLKGEAKVTDGTYERDEWEVDIGPSDDPQTWPAGEVRARALALTGGAPLAPTLAMRTRRRHIYAERDGARVAEISLDTGSMSAGGLSQLFRELEIELLPGADRAAFDELVALLRDRFALQPESQSKLARGLALLDAAEAG